MPKPPRPLTEPINLKEYPVDVRDNLDKTITLGDLHGNTMKLIWSLIREGMIKMDSEDFDSAWDIYSNLNFNTETPTEIADNTAILLENFKDILDRITINPQSNLRLLGDVLADRGENDYLTLLLIKKLKEDSLDIEFIFSNHDQFLLNNYKNPVTTDDDEGLRLWGKNEEWDFHNSHDQQHSMVSLFAYIKRGLVQQKEIIEIIDECFLTSMKLISYELSEGGAEIYLFMHAPNNFTSIKKLAIEFGLTDESYKPKSAIELAEMIDRINEALLDFQSQKPTPTSSLEKTIKRFVWNRLPASVFGSTPRTINFNTYPPFVKRIAHGHTTSPKSNRQINLDNRLGKKNTTKGNYIALITNKTPSLEKIRAKNITKARAWIKDIRQMAQEETKEHSKETLFSAADAAEELLDGYIEKKPKNIQKQLGDNFKETVDKLQELKIGKLSWKNIANIFIFIPSIIKYIKTDKKQFWFRKPPIKNKNIPILLG